MANIIQINGFGISSSNAGGGASDFPYTGSAIISGSLVITGSTTSTLGFTGSLFGTSSWATNALTASSALTASRLNAANTSIFAAIPNRMIITASNGVLMYGGNLGVGIESNFYVSGSVLFDSLITSSTTHVLTYDTFTKLVHFTASSAIGGGGSTFNSTSSIVGDDTNAVFNINHGFNTRNLHITVYDSASGDIVYPDLKHVNANTSSVTFANAPKSSNPYIVYISQ